ncbi:MAG: hypothetical protein HETSPECPRED_008456 [Heterodermia speciosa]|uniref:Uncharacterized protein n=1 Tax=Heterodermia speciosa TaxID=116794 RepID=A0A8H3FZ72_9LECA|nr:MAG: hypothetical protein HETSPECPRED_008456 [Heterodermia speciosa]
MPFAFTPATPSSPAAQMRLFVEPQYLHTPFTAIANPYGESTSVVQLPRIWKHKQDPPYRKEMAIYIYARGSPFEDIMNHYMTTGIPINPFDPVFEKSVEKVGNGTTDIGDFIQMAQA